MLTRRQVIGGGLATAAASALAYGIGSRGSSGEGDGQEVAEGQKDERMPVIFVPHGGGPWPFVETGLGEPEELADLEAYLRSIGQPDGKSPEAVLAISAHWEEAIPTVMTCAAPPMLYDYYGFPPESYEITWPAPGTPKLAARVRELLASAGFETCEDDSRGFDHGTFVPLKLAYPDAEVPTMQLSLVKGLDTKTHLRLGRAMAPLRDEGVLIIGSGMTYHNLRAFNPGAAQTAATFDDWLQEAVAASPKERDELLSNWENAPFARQAHPREEHLIPLLVTSGAAQQDQGTLDWTGTILNLQLSAYRFG